MLPQFAQSSLYMQDEEKCFEYVAEKMQKIYNFNPEDQEQLLQFRELVRHVIILYNKAKELETLEYGEQ